MDSSSKDGISQVASKEIPSPVLPSPSLPSPSLQSRRPGARPISWATLKSRPNSTTSPALTSPRSPGSPLLGDKFEGMWRPISGSYTGKLPTVDEKYTGLGVDEDGSDRPSHERAQRHSHFIQQFPAEPEKLSVLPPFEILLADIGLALLPLIFIIYGILAGLLHNRPTSSFYFGDGTYNWSGELYGPTMLKLQNYIPTFFPMAFGIEVARLTKSFATWRAQRGTHLGFLEQLMRSRSLGGTISTIFDLRIINWVGILLLTIWALAPVGSQAGLRIISANGTYVNTTLLNYMDTEAIPTGLQAASNDLQYYSYAVNSLYSTSLLTPASVVAPQDPWTNVKIPSLEYLEETKGCGQDGWCSRTLATENMGANVSSVTAGTWSSLTGLPVIGGEFGVGIQNFTLSASYYVFKCSSLDVVASDIDFNSTIPDRGVYDTSDNSSIWDSGNTAHPSTFFVDTTTPLAGLGSADGDARLEGASMSPRTLIFGSRAPNGTSVANCSVYTSYVLAEVNCNFSAPLWNIDKTLSGKTSSGACYVDRIRRDPAHPTLDPYTPLDANYRIPQRFFEQWPLATGNVPGGSSSPTERFINDVSTESASSSTSSILVATDWLGFNSTNTNNDNGISYVDIAELDIETFTQRFSLVFNTFWHAFCNLQAMTQSEIGLGFGDAFPGSVMFRSVNATLSVPGQHYTVNFVWLGIYMVCAILSFVAGIFTLVFNYSTLMPDVLGSVSVMVKDNPYTPLPKGGSAMEGPIFARKVMHMPVRFADVKANEAVGHIALVSMDVEDPNVPVEPLKKGRLYH
ncbi:hypothetical protein LTR10_018443 [Elasticomyces elasticus]|uniref:Uncharacterized protein n=1 Tax=Exophiala sideris TaxID=1016849 RepID=A0ABR0J8W9_9EURO|nr:hypothetical protein LTR10_018443 [Elasticomyces elasticus]KAK5029497.1 hypothetical protein LTS07_005959 [Exophiala sideris]KAK5036806.1 hypothetical protein LTR13_005186 [Exophiala sideris]KAK5058127.1 hypothetical protein LTR69_007124 [Exophiala sideris]KAK5182086.1 hypothetical protein LTR44_005687 [Eurotiomycetes sp. CCFEE 6388]